MTAWGALFCEEPIFPDTYESARNNPGWCRAMSLKVDNKKLRLVSVETKGEIGSGDLDTNPAMGKFEQFHQMINWVVDGRNVLSQRRIDLFMYLFLRGLAKNHRGT